MEFYLLFGVSLILTNCEKDDDNQPKSDLLNKNKSINQTSLSELLNQNFLSEETFGLMAKKQNTSLNDKATEPTFKLSSSKGLKYLDKGNTYHVFLMERTDKTDPYYYNLVVHEHEETLEKYIYKYPLDKTENVTISKITNKDIQSARKSVPVPVVKDLGDGCTETYLYDVTPCPCVGHIDPNICTCPIKPAWKFKGGPYYYCPALDTNNPIIVMPDNNNGVNTSKGITTNDPDGCYSNGDGMTECEPLDERPILLAPLPVLEPDFGKNEGITSTLELSNVQKLWLEKLENLNFKSDIEEYLNQYVFTNKFNQAKAFAISAITALMNSGEITSLSDYIAQVLDDLLGEDPFLLLEIDCDQIQKWQTLAQHTAPQSVQDKINNLPSSITNDFEIQALSDASGTAVNLDYFSVNITELPDDPNTNTPFTADEFLDYVRRNFDDFVIGSTFEPYCEDVQPSICQQETDLWNSNNPLGALIYIDIPMDDGVVVCSEYTNSYWYFMTMNAPFAGNHPVSGTRQFGYEQGFDGSYNFFVRGVDRIDSGFAELLLSASGNAFFGADDLWESFQNKTRDFINNNSGNSTIVTPIKNRPDWNKVEEVLQGRRPISDLGCN